jgi:hypothetical protein
MSNIEEVVTKFSQNMGLFPRGSAWTTKMKLKGLSSEIDLAGNGINR